MNVTNPWKGIKSTGWLALLCSLIIAACSAKATVLPIQQVETASPAAHMTDPRDEPTRPPPTATQVTPPTSTSTQVPATQTLPPSATTETSPYPAPPTLPPSATIVGPYPAPSMDTVTPIPTGTETMIVAPTETPAPTLPGVVTPGEGTELAPGGWQPSSGAYPVPGAEDTSVPGQPEVSPTPIPTATVEITLPGPSSPATATTGPSSPYPGPGTTPSQSLPASPTVIITPGFAPSLTPPATSPQFTVTPTSPITGTVTLGPSIPLVVRVTQKVTDPATVRLDAGQIQLVEFFAAWSNLSKSMAPVLNGLEAKYGGRIQFTYLDVDDKANSRFKQALGYQFPPHLFLLDGQGKALKIWKGYVRVEELEEAFANQGVGP